MTDQQGDARHLETLDRDLERFSRLELATAYVSRPIVGPGFALLFVLLAGAAALVFFGQASNTAIVALAACLGASLDGDGVAALVDDGVCIRCGRNGLCFCGGWKGNN